MKIRGIPMLTALFLALMIFGGCPDQNELNKTKKEVEEMQGQLDMLKEINNELNKTKKEVEEMQEQLNDLKKVDKDYFIPTISKIQEMQQPGTIYLDPTSKNYQKIDSDGYIFLIGVEDIVQYAEGYKLTLSIGNPYLIRFNGFQLSIYWGKEFDSKKDNYNEWEKSLRNKIETFTGTLYPGYWNKVELVISPAKEDEIGHLELSMTTSDLTLTPYFSLTPARK